MAGFESGSSVAGSDHSINFAKPGPKVNLKEVGYKNTIILT